MKVEEIEELLQRLPAVQAVRVVANAWGAIEEVHILATAERTPKQLVRDVESSLAARWGLHLDHRKISIAQLAEEGTDTGEAFRLKMASLRVLNQAVERRLEIEVSLLFPRQPGRDERSLVGRAAGTNSRQQAVRLAAQAAVEALAQILPPQWRLHVEEAQVITLAGYHLVISLVQLVPGGGRSELLSGSALVHHDPLDAAVRATLDATNRRLGRLLATLDWVAKREAAATGEAGSGDPFWPEEEF